MMSDKFLMVTVLLVEKRSLCTTMRVMLKQEKEAAAALATPEAPEAPESPAVVKITNCRWQQANGRSPAHILYCCFKGTDSKWKQVRQVQIFKQQTQ